MRCASGPVSSGLDALDDAGISWEGTQRFPGIVCRIAGQPTAATEPCGNTPPASAYWSYWVAPRGGSWCYSKVGAGSRTPPPGSVEGWSFALDRVAVDIPPPGYDPPAPIPGESPNPLKGADCGAPSGSQPPPPPTTSPPAPPTTLSAPPSSPATTSHAPDAGPPSSAPASDEIEPGSGSPSPTVNTVAGPAAEPGSGTTTSHSTQTTVMSAGATSTTRPRSASTTTTTFDDASDSHPATSVRTAELGAVDLGNDGRGGGSFGPATAIGIAVAASLGGAGVWAARRRRALL